MQKGAQGVPLQNNLAVLGKAGVQMGEIPLRTAELGEIGGKLGFRAGEGEPVPAVEPAQGGVRAGGREGTGGGEKVLQPREGEPEPLGRPDPGEHQHAAGIRIGLDFNGAVQGDARLAEGGLGQLQRPLQGELGGGEAVLFSVGRSDVQRGAGGADGLDGHKERLLLES